MTYEIQIIFDYNRRAYIDVSRLELKRLAQACDLFDKHLGLAIKYRLYQPEIYGNKITLEFMQAVRACNRLNKMRISIEGQAILNKLENALNDYAI